MTLPIFITTVPYHYIIYTYFYKYFSMCVSMNGCYTTLTKLYEETGPWRLQNF